MLFERYFSDGAVTLGPFTPEQHVPFLAQLATATPYALDDAFRPDPEGLFAAMVHRPDTWFATAWDGDRLSGVVYLAGIHAGRDAYFNGYGLPMHPSMPARAARLTLRFAFEHLRLVRVSTINSEHNRAVHLVLRRAGFVQEGRHPAAGLYGGRPCAMLSFGAYREA